MSLLDAALDRADPDVDHLLIGTEPEVDGHARFDPVAVVQTVGFRLRAALAVRFIAVAGRIIEADPAHDPGTDTLGAAQNRRQPIIDFKGAILVMIAAVVLAVQPCFGDLKIDAILPGSVGPMLRSGEVRLEMGMGELKRGTFIRTVIGLQGEGW